MIVTEENYEHAETAFPSEFWYGDKGMSLRDYFAAAALTGMLADSMRTANLAVGEAPNSVTAEINADWAYELADAMLKERDK